uniref:Cilia and flagella associated protein 184 n=1 Tax=Mastacembelus armatus TaxID=205130 RepID=A0A3Q3KVV1_9TELE
MDPEHEETDVKNYTERDTSDDLFKEKDGSLSTVNRNEKENAPDDMAASDHEDKNFEIMKSTEKPAVGAALSEPRENSGNDLHGVDITTDLEVKMNEVNELPMSSEETVVFKVHSSDEDVLPKSHLDSPEEETTACAQKEEEDEEVESKPVPLHTEDISWEEYKESLRELCEERDKVSQHNSQLQMKLAEYFRKKAWNDSQLEKETHTSEPLQVYKKYINILTDLKQRVTTNSEKAQQQTEELRIQAQEKLDQVENEWRALMALKQDVAVSALSQHLGKQAAQVKVESILAAEQLRQDELIKLRLKHIKLRIKIQRLEADLRDGEERDKDPLQIQFEQLQAEKLEQKNQSVLCFLTFHQLLSNTKEKLYWSQMEIQAKRDQLAELEAMVARKRDLLTKTKQARNRLQRDNQRLKEHRGLLGNRVLLQDFEDTVDAADCLEEQLENLKCREAEIVFSCGIHDSR